VGFIFPLRTGVTDVSEQNRGAKGWREHRWIYDQLTDSADVLIGKVLQALHKSEVEKNTIVVFTSDHGENNGSHRLDHKTVFYNEASRIPFIFAGKGIKSGVVINHHVSMGLDLYPTLCDLAGIDVPDRLPGISLVPYLKGKDPSSLPKYTFLEDQIGFMVTDGRFKYSWYDDETNDQMLIDLKKDP
jgi:choline-sulfatase